VIDLHAHLLAGVDDGPETLAESIAMCRRAAADGCVALVATPHQRRDEWQTADGAALEAKLAELAARLAEGGESPRLYLGAEVRVDSELAADLAAPGRRGIRTLAGSRYLLLELEPHGLGPDPVELVGELRAAGFGALIAHPELTPCLWQEDELLERLAAAGALFQVTAMSVTGELGRPARDRAWALLEGELVAVVASDAHRPDWRPPGLARAHAAIGARLGLAVAQKLTFSNPLAILEDRPIVAGASLAAG
jgi:protein-tyrosine phosphatase